MQAVSASNAAKAVFGAPNANRSTAAPRINVASPFKGRVSALKPASRTAVPAKASRDLAVKTRALFGGATKVADGLYSMTAKDIDGKDVKLSAYKGKVLLVVNVASACGFTPQYKGLQELFSKYKSKGFEVLAFPCNQFGSQEAGDNAAIKSFAMRQGAQFKMMSKVDVNGGNADPVWDFLKSKQGGLLTSDIKWNFSKFLVDREGNVVKRYPSTTEPKDIAKDIESFL